MLNQRAFVDELLAFLAAGVTPFHAVAEMAGRLRAAGFEALDEAAAWQLRPAGRYFTTRNGSSLIAWVQGGEDLVEAGLRLFGAHTDSPCLKIKPRPEQRQQGCDQLSVSPYGGVLLNPWFDRDLSLAGRVVFATPDGAVDSALIDFARPVASIPSLAIHLDKEANSKRSINPQQHLPLVIGIGGEQPQPGFRTLLHRELQRQYPALAVSQVLDYDLNCYDVQAPAIVGIDGDFIASARLDNLLSCFTGLQALLDADPAATSLLVCNDHEEVGSGSAEGADGPMLRDVLGRLTGGGEVMLRAISRSLLISADNAHAVHPNYADRHDAGHGPRINGGPVIKFNANQRYASNSRTAGLFRRLCAAEGVPVQSFVVRSDMGCGSTIGPITAGNIGIDTVDVGAPQWAMHSIRETAGVRDCHYLYRVSRRFYETPRLDAPL